MLCKHTIIIVANFGSRNYEIFFENLGVNKIRIEIVIIFAENKISQTYNYYDTSSSIVRAV